MSETLKEAQSKERIETKIFFMKLVEQLSRRGLSVENFLNAPHHKLRVGKVSDEFRYEIPMQQLKRILTTFDRFQCSVPGCLLSIFTSFLFHVLLTVWSLEGSSLGLAVVAFFAFATAFVCLLISSCKVASWKSPGMNTIIYLMILILYSTLLPRIYNSRKLSLVFKLGLLRSVMVIPVLVWENPLCSAVIQFVGDLGMVIVGTYSDGAILEPTREKNTQLVVAAICYLASFAVSTVYSFAREKKLETLIKTFEKLVEALYIQLAIVNQLKGIPSATVRLPQLRSDSELPGSYSSDDNEKDPQADSSPSNLLKVSRSPSILSLRQKRENQEKTSKVLPRDAKDPGRRPSVEEMIGKKAETAKPAGLDLSEFRAKGFESYLFTEGSDMIAFQLSTDHLISKVDFDAVCSKAMDRIDSKKGARVGVSLLEVLDAVGDILMKYDMVVQLENLELAEDTKGTGLLEKPASSSNSAVICSIRGEANCLRTISIRVKRAEPETVRSLQKKSTSQQFIGNLTVKSEVKIQPIPNLTSIPLEENEPFFTPKDHQRIHFSKGSKVAATTKHSEGQPTLKRNNSNPAALADDGSPNNEAGSSWPIEEMVSVVVHDMRSPLMCIQGNLELIDFELKQSRIYDLVAPLIKSSSAAATLLEMLVNDILDSARISKGIFKVSEEKCDLEEIIKESLETVRMAAKSRKNELSYEYSGERFIVSDKQRIKQVILNFLSNSIKFTKCGKITVSVKEVRKKMVISVEDNGEGMSPQEITALFEKFSSNRTSRSNSKGIGLGLFICKSIIETLGPKNQIRVQSQPGKGTKITFEIFSNISEKEIPLKYMVASKNRMKSENNCRTSIFESFIEDQKRRKSIDIFELNNQGVQDSRRVIEVRKKTRMSKEDRPVPQRKLIRKQDTVREEAIEESFAFQNLANVTKDQNQSIIRIHKASILLVDDDPMILDLLEMYSAQVAAKLGLKLKVDTAQSLEDAKTMARRGFYDVIVSDLNLPDGSGPALVSSLREIYTSTSKKPLFLLVTGQTDDSELQALAPYFFEVLQKPVSLDYWFFIISKCVDRLGEDTKSRPTVFNRQVLLDNSQQIPDEESSVRQDTESITSQ